MNAQILGIIKAKNTIFGMQIYQLFLEFAIDVMCHSQRP